jgi:hypothetical protein
VSVVRVRHDSCAAGWRRGQEQRQNRNTRQGMLLAASKARKASDWRAPQPHSVGTQRRAVVQQVPGHESDLQQLRLAVYTLGRCHSRPAARRERWSAHVPEQ